MVVVVTVAGEVELGVGVAAGVVAVVVDVVVGATVVVVEVAGVVVVVEVAGVVVVVVEVVGAGVVVIVGQGGYIPPHSCANAELERAADKKTRKASLGKENLNISSISFSAH